VHERTAMSDPKSDCLRRQFDTAWKLVTYHLDGLTTEECLWRPAERGLHVARGADGRWRGDWPEHEGYDLGPPSIAWLTWHVGFWWSWQRRVAALGADDLRSSAMTRWPFTDRPFMDVIAWVNLELMKNAAEIGYARFLHTGRIRAIPV
jgi:hypothetical protein